MGALSIVPGPMSTEEAMRNAKELATRPPQCAIAVPGLPKALMLLMDLDGQSGRHGLHGPRLSRPSCPSVRAR